MLGAVAGYAVDRCFGEPPDAVHPMIAVGTGLTHLEAALYQDRRASGAAHLGVAIGAAALVGHGLRFLIGPTASTALTVAVCSSSKMLGSTALEVAAALMAGDLDDGRQRVRALVGRDPSALTEADISRAVVESIAENTVDGVTSTFLWAVAGGAPAVLVHRVTNTLDAMVGHRNERYLAFGWASARTDDVLNWVPARLTAAAIAAASSDPWHVLAIVRRDGAKHPSPNGGRVEAAAAASIGVTLGGINDYGGKFEVRGPLGDGRPPQPSDIETAVRLTRRASDLLGLFSLGIATSIIVAQRARR